MEIALMLGFRGKFLAAFIATLSVLALFTIPVSADDAVPIGIGDAVDQIPMLRGTYLEVHWNVEHGDGDQGRIGKPTQYIARILHYHSGGLIVRVDHAYGAECYSKVRFASKMWVSPGISSQHLVGLPVHQILNFETTVPQLHPLYYFAVVEGYELGELSSTDLLTLDGSISTDEESGSTVLTFLSHSDEVPRSIQFVLRDGVPEQYAYRLHSPKKPDLIMPIQRGTYKGVIPGFSIPESGFRTVHLPVPAKNEEALSTFRFEIKRAEWVGGTRHEEELEQELLQGLVELRMGEAVGELMPNAARQSSPEQNSVAPESVPPPKSKIHAVRLALMFTGGLLILIGVFFRFRNR